MLKKAFTAITTMYIEEHYPKKDFEQETKNSKSSD
jgi:hypothetical protein